MMVDLKIPKLSANDPLVRIVKWHRAPGEHVEKGALLVELGTSKVNIDVVAESSGFVEQIRSEGDDVLVGETYARLHDKKPAQEQVLSEESRGGPRYSASARRFAEENKIDLAALGFRGLVTVRDVQLASVPSEAISHSKELEINALEIGQRGPTASVTVAFEGQALHRRIRAMLGQDAGPLSFVISEAFRILPEFPKFTAWYESGRIFYYDRIDIGVAFDVGRGLKVLNIGNLENLEPSAIHERLLALAMRDLRGEIDPSETVGSSFTISDLSTANVQSFVPLINGRQSAILGIGGDREMPGMPVTITLTFDHRVLTGREASDFLNRLKKALVSG